MTIRNDQSYMEGIWDWGILRGCFGTTNIEPTDIDGLVERNGHFLVIETKRPGVMVPLGQDIMFRSFVKACGAVVIVVWGERNSPAALRVYSTQHPDGRNEDNAGIERLRLLVTRWFEKANAATVPD